MVLTTLIFLPCPILNIISFKDITDHSSPHRPVFVALTLVSLPSIFSLTVIHLLKFVKKVTRYFNLHLLPSVRHVSVRFSRSSFLITHSWSFKCLFPIVIRNLFIVHILLTSSSLLLWSLPTEFLGRTKSLSLQVSSSSLRSVSGEWRTVNTICRF